MRNQIKCAVAALAFAALTIGSASSLLAADPPTKPAKPSPNDADFVPGAIAIPSGKTFRVEALPGQNFLIFNNEQDKYWVGLMCSSAPDVLRTQLSLPAGSGLVVDDVMPKSPGATAGIQRNDILLSAGGQPLADLPALGKIVNENGTKPIELSVLRGGKPMTLKLTPAERPVAPQRIALPPGAERKAITEWTEQLRKLAGDAPRLEPGRPLRLRFLHPGKVVGANVPEKPFPADLSVTIVREGNNPAKISVKQGDKSWQVSPDQLDKLPAEVRPHVEGMLRHLADARGAAVKIIGPDNVKFEAVEGIQLPQVEFAPAPAGPPGTFEVPAPPPGPNAGAVPLPPPPQAAPPVPPNGGQHQAQIDELRREVQKLQQRLDQLGGEK